MRYDCQDKGRREPKPGLPRGQKKWWMERMVGVLSLSRDGKILVSSFPEFYL